MNVSEALFDDVTIRAYFASVVGAVRLPYGKRGSQIVNPGQSRVLAKNATKDRVLSVAVSRSDSAGTVLVVFSQNDEGSNSVNDFAVNFGNNGVQRFVLRPGEIVAVTVPQGGGISPSFVIGQETY